MTMKQRFVWVVAVCLCVPALARAQTPPQANDDSRSHWGIAGSFTPQWQFLDFLEDSMDRIVDMTGNEMRVGIVRGRQLGGEWGVSYVKRPIEDDSSFMQEKPKCLAGTGQPEVCAAGNTYRTRGAFMNGIQLHRFFPLATIARRVQIGAVVSGGVARIEGHADETQEHLQIVVNPGTGVPTLSVAAEPRTVEAREMLSHTFVAEYMPIGGVEAAVAVLLAPGVKLRVSSGAAFPGYHTVSVTAQYLFGAR
jgi:hypothetical protein